MPAKKQKQEKSSQSVKVNINLGETKKQKKTRGKRKPSQKKLPAPLGIGRQFPFSQQPQYIPLYVNQYPSYAGAGSPNYMNAGLPANPALLAGTSTAPLLLTNGSATTPTTAMTRMTSNKKFNIPESFYIPTEKPKYPLIDLKKRIEDIARPKLIKNESEPEEILGREEFEKRREELVTFFDERSGLPIKSKERGEREGEDYISMGRDPQEAGDEMEFFNVEFVQDDDADEGFFDTIDVDGMPALEQINFA